MSKCNLALPTSKGLLFVKKTDVLYCCSEGAYTHIYVSGGRKITVSKNLKEVENAIADEQFVRIHASHLVNLDHATGFINNGYNCIIMSNGEELNVARSRKQELMDFFVKI